MCARAHASVHVRTRERELIMEWNDDGLVDALIVGFVLGLSLGLVLAW